MSDSDIFFIAHTGEQVLTDNVEPERQRHLRLCVDLAFVDAGIAPLRELNLQRPVV